MVNNSKTGNERGLVFTEKKLKFFLVLADIVYESAPHQNKLPCSREITLLYILMSKISSNSIYIGTTLNQMTKK